MADENEPLPWDYFLTDYERDLLRLPIEDALRKYPSIAREQMESDLRKLTANQDRFMVNNGQNERPD